MNPACRLLVGLWAIGSLADSSFVSELWVRDDFLKAPKAAFVAGAHVQLGQSDTSLAVGVVPIPFPIELPEVRGPLLYNPLPTYSHRGGLSEWGKGWDGAMSIHRTAESGEVNCDVNSFASPWGKLQASNQAGVYYPKGLEIDVRVVKTSGGFMAYHPEGKVFEFTQKQGEFAWYLTQVKDREGHKTFFEYIQNSFHRPLLSKILYGGKKRAQYETQITYERLSFPIKRYGACGLETTIDSRVHQIELKHSSKLYRLVYDGVYLSKIETAKLPDIDYHYGKINTVLKKPRQRINYQFQDATDGLDDWRFFSKNISWVDFNQDGLMDMERATDLKSFVQRPSGGFEAYQDSYVESRSYLCPPSGPFNEFMAPAELRRLLIRPAGIKDKLVHLRLANDVDITGTRTALIVCTLDGQVEYQKEVFHEQESGMSFEDSTHLVDFNGDLKPDLVRVGHGQYTYILGESTPNHIQFSDKVTRPLPGADNRRVITYNLVDFNSDGFVDVVAQVSDGVLVWYGKGNGVLGPEEFHYPFKNPEGFSLYLPKMEGISLVDVNRDGLVDLIGRLGSSWVLFVQNGENLAEQEFPALDHGVELMNSAKVVNLSAGGNDQLAVLEWRLGYVAFDLNEPSTGLLTHIENNQGLSYEIDYAWTKPQEGVPQLLIVPKSLTIAVAGGETKKRFYEFENAEIDVKNGGLIGFKRVKTTRSKLLTTTDFLVSSDFQPKTQVITQVDARVDLPQIHKNIWGESVLEGIRYLQLINSTQSYVSQGLETLQRSIAFSAYDRLCAKAILEKTLDGELERQITYSGSVGCLKTGEKLIGRHSNHPAFDFEHVYEINRNEAELPLSLDLFSDSQKIPKMALTYGSDFNIQQVNRASTGVTLLDYDPVFEVLRSLTEPDGTTYAITEFNSQADAMSGLVTKQADGQSLTQRFSYDDFHRLNHTANDWTQSAYVYRLANQTAPGLVSDSLAQLTTVFSGDGSVLTTARAGQDGFFYENLHRSLSSDSKEQEIDLSRMYRNPEDLSFQTLEAEDRVLIETERSELFGNLNQRLAINEQYTHDFARKITLNARELETAILENNRYPTEEARSSYKDEFGLTTHFERDTLDRLREIKLPSGELHKITLDGFGRTKNIERSRVGNVSYVYDNAHDRLLRKTFLSDEDLFEYDFAGRVKSRNGYKFSYQGQRLIEVKYADFTKSYVYASDALPVKKSLIENKSNLSIELEFKYNAVRDLVEQKVSCRQEYTKHLSYNSYRQLESVRVGNSFFKIQRDQMGKVAKIELPDGKEFIVEYDARTGKRMGYEIPGVAVYRWHLNARGLIGETEFLPATHKPQSFGFEYYPDKTLKSRYSKDNLFAVLAFESPKMPESYVHAERPEGVYDENRHLLAKYQNGKLAYLKFEDLSADANHIYEKLSIEGIDIGILIDGEFQLVLFDQVGSVIAIDNFVTIPTPFGEREHSLAWQEHFDFAGQGRDIETGLIRMGERDYDPALHRFTSPDRFFIENPEECVRSPQECDLFSYARNNPLLYIDSDGQNAKLGWAVAAGVVTNFPAVKQAATNFYHSPSGKNTGRLVAEVLLPSTPIGRALLKGVHSVEASEKLIYRNADEGSYHHKFSRGKKSPSPTNGQAVLDKSIELMGTNKLRIGVDAKENELVVFRYTSDTADGRIYHGHATKWERLENNIKSAFLKNGLTGKNGKIIGGD